MRKMIIVLLIWFTSNLDSAKFGNHYIIIQALNSEKGYLKPLLITEEKIITATKHSDTALASFVLKKPLSKLQIDSEMTFKYDRLVTDSKSFSGLVNFINENKSFFIIDLKPKLLSGNSYSVTIDGHVYVIDPRKKIEYFEKLKKEIIKKKYDVRIIKALSNYQSNFH